MKAYLYDFTPRSANLQRRSYELAVCAKALNGLSEAYMQIKAAARASQVTTIPRLTNLLISAERERGDSSIGTQQEIKNLSTELTSLNTHLRRRKIKHHTPTNNVGLYTQNSGTEQKTEPTEDNDESHNSRTVSRQRY
jgi:hypothetical protein